MVWSKTPITPAELRRPLRITKSFMMIMKTTMSVLLAVQREDLYGLSSYWLVGLSLDYFLERLKDS